MIDPDKASDPTTRQAQKWLRDIIREFTLAVGRLNGTKPTLTVRIARRPQDGSFEREHTVPGPVFDMFRDVLMAESQAGDAQSRFVRVNSFDGSNYPWFDLSIEGSENAFLFRVHIVHPISLLKSSA